VYELTSEPKRRAQVRRGHAGISATSTM